MTDLAPILPKLERLIPRLASDQDGEVVATAHAITRTLRGLGADWFDVVAALRPAPAPPSGANLCSDGAAWRENVAFLLSFGTDLSARDLAFLAEMERRLSRGGMPSEKQAKWLRDIARKVGVPA